MSTESVCVCENRGGEKQKPTKDKKIADKKQQDITSDKGKYYYTPEEEELLAEIKELMKLKSLRGKGGCCKGEEIDKTPPTRCKVKLAIFARHDRKRCTGRKEYRFVGEIIYPVCTKGIFVQEPGVPLRRSKKGFFLNDPSSFGKNFIESRIFAYPEPVLTPLCPCK